MSSLTITTIQSNIFWENKEANLKMFEEKINSINQQTEIIILPETFTTGFTQNAAAFAETISGATFQWMKYISEKKKSALVGSYIIEENGKFFNRLIWMLPNGNFGFYDKRHLFSYGGEDKEFSSGNKRLIASVKGWKIHLQICYDLRFPVWTRQQMQNNEPEYDVLINVANWPAQRDDAWKTLLQARSIENIVYTFGVNRTGIDENKIAYKGNTSVIDPLGNILYRKENEEDIFTVTLQKETLTQIREKYSFLQDADHFRITE